MTKQTWTQKTLTKIASGELSEGEIRMIRQRIGFAFTRGYAPRDKISPDEARELLMAVAKHCPRVSDAQARKGAEWLYKVNFTPKGARRNTDLAREFSERDLDVIKALQTKPEFKLIDMAESSNGYWTVYFPTYRAISDAGSFDYTAAAWQSGGRTFVESHA